MTIIELKNKINKLAYERQWGNMNIRWDSNVSQFLISRVDLLKYKQAYMKVGYFRTLGLSYSHKRYLPIVDKWLVEAIRHFIPETKKCTFKLYTLGEEDVNYVYPPEF